MCFNCNTDCKKVFWLESPDCLFSNAQIIPNQNMSLEERMNAITRLIIIVFVILLIMKHKNALAFLIVGLIIVIIAYYSQKKEKSNLSKVFKYDNAHNKDKHYTNSSNSYDINNLEYGRTRFFAEAGSKNFNNIQVIKKKPNPRRPYPSIVSPSLEVKTSKQYTEETFVDENMYYESREPNYIYVRGPSIYLEDVTPVISRSKNLNIYNDDNINDNTPRKSGYDLYQHRMSKLATDVRAKHRIDTQSQINSIF